MAEAKPASPTEEDRFDAYLRERFAELKRELDAHLSAAAYRPNLAEKSASKGNFSLRGGSLVAIAALLLVAISVPLVLQLNLQREHARTTWESKAGGDEFAQTAAPKDSSPQRNFEGIPAKNQTNSEEASGSQEAGHAVKNREQLPSVKDNPADELAVEGAEAEPVVKTRSATINDTQFRLKREELEAIEKGEMEELWKEYEKNPEVFSRNKQKLQRLKQLLDRYDTKSRARRLIAE